MPSTAVGRVILNVDDHAPARYVRTRILQRAGYGVDEADSAAGAIERARNAALVLLDVKLPDADGFTVCERVKAERPGLPVVMVTSVYRTSQARRDAFAVGADAYLLEPVDPDRLLSTIEQVMATRAVVGRTVAAAFAITDAVGTIEALSADAAKLLNLSQRGAIGRSLPMYFVDNRPRLMAELLRAAEGVIIERGAVLHPRDRRPREVQLDISIMPDVPGAPIRLKWVIGTPDTRA